MATLTALWLMGLGLLAAAPVVEAQAPRPGVRLRFPDGVDLTGLSIRYFATGPFGGHGNFVRTSPEVREYVLETSHKGQPVKTLKAIVHCPGYRIILLSREVLGGPDDDATIALEPLNSLPLAGRVVGADDPLRLNVEVEYLAHWSHGFFGITDGAVVTFTVATAPLMRDGSFVTRVPDFAKDAAVAGRRGFDRGVFVVRVRDRTTGNLSYSLEQMHRSGVRAEIPLADGYPEELMLVAVRSPG